MLLARSRSMPVGLVIRPILRPRSWRKESRLRTSIPLSAGPSFGRRVELRRIAASGARAPGTLAKSKPSIARAARVPSSCWSGTTLPFSSGWLRLERKMVEVFEKGSIQIRVPVHPVWP